MNKKEISEIRKEFKDSTYRLKFKGLYSVYIKKEQALQIHKEFYLIDNLEAESKEMYFTNFKKVLSSSIDTKLFELDFSTSFEEGTFQKILHSSVESNNIEDMVSNLDMIIDRITAEYRWESDIVVNFIKAEYMKGNKKRNVEADEAEDDSVQPFEFIICSINKIEVPKKVMTYDFSSKCFAPSSGLEVIVNLGSPLEGFMFPSFEAGYANVSKILYYNPKVKELNNDFIENVLCCKPKLTALDEKEVFQTILSSVVGSKVKAETIAEIYTKINEKGIETAEEEELPATIGAKEIKKILEDSGIKDAENIEEIFEQNCGPNYDFKVTNIIPDLNSKSIRITNESTDISINPRDLSLVRQIKDQNGKKCLLIEITEDLRIDGFELETEESSL